MSLRHVFKDLGEYRGWKAAREPIRHLVLVEVLSRKIYVFY